MKPWLRCVFPLLLLTFAGTAGASLSAPPPLADQLALGAVVIEADVTAVEDALITSGGDTLPVRYFTLENVDPGSATIVPGARLLLPGSGTSETSESDNIVVSEKLFTVN